jgi:hypothetical protein
MSPGSQIPFLFSVKNTNKENTETYLTDVSGAAYGRHTQLMSPGSQIPILFSVKKYK